MDYKTHYDALIKRAKTRKLNEYVERHHVIPRCMGGTDDKSNLVELTPEEHFVAHQLLVKIYPGVDALVYAASKMTVSSKNVKRNNKLYGWLRRKYQSVCKKRIGDKNPSYGKSWYYDPLTLNEGKFLKSDVPLNWIPGRKSTKPSKPENLKSSNKIVVEHKTCKKCGHVVCTRKAICRNGQRIKRLVDNFNFDRSTIGTVNFYSEYDRVINKIKNEYLEEKLSVEDLRKIYGISTNETMRCILRSFGIERRNLSDAVKNFRSKSG